MPDDDASRHVALLAPFYAPETNAGAERVTAFVRAFQAANWRVSIVTLSPHHPQNHIYDGYDLPSPDRREERGVSVIRIRPFLVPKDHLPLRLLSESLFTLQAMPHLLRLRPDAIVASSPYMFLGPAGLLTSRLRRSVFAWDVRDLTWLYPRAAGKRTFGIDRLLEAVMRFTAARADALSATTQGQLDHFPRLPRRSIVLPNGVSDAWLERLLAIPPLKPDATDTVVYAGLFGYNHALETLIRAAERLPHVRFLLVGDGPDAPALKELASYLGLGNVEFWGYVPHDRLITAYQQASVLVLHVRGGPVFQRVQSAKIWEYLATGRPVIHASEDSSTAFLEANGFALTVPPEQPEVLAQRIQALLDDREGTAAMTQAARAFVAAERRRSTLNQQLVDLVTQVTAPGA